MDLKNATIILMVITVIVTVIVIIKIIVMMITTMAILVISIKILIMVIYSFVIVNNYLAWYNNITRKFQFVGKFYLNGKLHFLCSEQ